MKKFVNGWAMQTSICLNTRLRQYSTKRRVFDFSSAVLVKSMSSRTSSRFSISQPLSLVQSMTITTHSWLTRGLNTMESRTQIPALLSLSKACSQILRRNGLMNLLWTRFSLSLSRRLAPQWNLWSFSRWCQHFRKTNKLAVKFKRN